MNWRTALAFSFAIVALAGFPYGPLFAWSPVHPGYTKLRLERADVLYPDTFPQAAAYREFDRYVTWVEKVHELKCSRRITVIACRDCSDCRRFAGPLLLGQSPAAVTSPTGTVIFLTPYSFGSWDLGGLLRHELSHATLN